VTLPREKHDLTAIASQRDQIGRMIARGSAEVAPPLSRIVRQGGQTEPEDTDTTDTTAPVETAAPHVTRTLSEAKGSDPAPDDDPNDPMQQDPPDWIVQQASLSELLLWRLGIPFDRELIEREHRASQESVDLKPPITTRKVAHAIAHLSLQLMQGKIDANTAKTSLYALQTLLTALRLQIVEEKNARAKAKAQTSAGRRKPLAKRKR
jgi:hypothetical protein